MPTKKIEYKGQTHEFPDTWGDDKIAAALASDSATPPAAKGSSLLSKPTGMATVPGTGEARNQPGFMDQEWNPTSTPGRFTKALASTVGVPPRVRDVIQGPVQAMTHPVDSASMLLDAAGDAQQHETDRAYTLQHSPGILNKTKGLVRGVTSLIPVAGPTLGNMMDLADEGKYAEAAGTGAGLITGALMGHETLNPVSIAGDVIKGSGRLIKNSVGAVRYPNAAAMVKSPPEAMFNPIEANNPADLKAYAAKNNIPMTAAEILDNGPLKAIQGVAEKSASGTNAIATHKAAAKTGVYRNTKNLLQKASPVAGDDMSVGQGIQNQVKAAYNSERKLADKDYADWRSTQTGPITIDLTDVNRHFSNYLNTNEDILNNVPNAQASGIKSIAEKAKQFGIKVTDGEGNVALEPTMDLEAVREMRSHWLDAKRDMIRKGARADSREMRLMDTVTGKLDEAVENGIRTDAQQNHTKFQNPDGSQMNPAQAGDHAVGKWRDANARYKSLMDDFHGSANSGPTVLSDILDASDRDLSGLPDRVLGGNGGNRANIDLLRRRGIDLGPLRRRVIDAGVDKGFSSPRNRPFGYEDDFLQNLFAEDPKLLQDTYTNAQIARRVRANPNPSNTAGMNSATGDVEATMGAGMLALSGEPTAALAIMAHVPGAKWAAGKLTTAKWFNDWVTSQPKGKFGKWLVKKTEVDPSAGWGPDGPKQGLVPYDGSSGNGTPSDDTDFGFGANEPTPTPPKGGGSKKLKKNSRPNNVANIKSVPEWPAEYKNAASKLSKEGAEGGGANYTKEQLDAFKKKNGIKSEGEGNLGDVDVQKPGPGAANVFDPSFIRGKSGDIPTQPLVGSKDWVADPKISAVARAFNKGKWYEYEDRGHQGIHEFSNDAAEGLNNWQDNGGYNKPLGRAAQQYIENGDKGREIWAKQHDVFMGDPRWRQAQKIVELIRHSETRDGNLFRGISISPDNPSTKIYNNLKPGDHLLIRGPSPFSQRSIISHGFAYHNESGKMPLFKMQGVPGSLEMKMVADGEVDAPKMQGYQFIVQGKFKGINADVNPSYGESEVLTHGRFKVTQVSKDRQYGATKIFLKQLEVF